MLINAKNILLPNNVGGLPDVSAAVMEFLQPTVVNLIKQQLINGYYEPIPSKVNTQASIQPMEQALAIKMEGERSWKWSIIHILPNVDLQNNDKIILFGITYKIMKRENWFQHGYIRYFVVEEFTNAPTT